MCEKDELDKIFEEAEGVRIPETGIVAAQKVRKQLDIDWSIGY